MTLVMRDSTDPFLIPADPPVVAGYGVGRMPLSTGSATTGGA